MKKIFKFLIVAIIIATFVFIFPQFTFTQFNPKFLNLNENEKEETFVTKVIDGDTIIVEGGRHVRLLGIDTDEKGYPCYYDAKERLEQLILNKKVILEKDRKDKDQYGRLLRYVFLDGENINLKIVKEGLAVARFYPENEKYKQEIINAEEEARKNKIGCKWKNN